MPQCSIQKKPFKKLNASNYCNSKNALNNNLYSILHGITAFSTNPDHTVLNDQRVSALAEQKTPFSEVQRCANVSSAKTEMSIVLQKPLLSATAGPVSGNVAFTGCKQTFQRWETYK